MCSIIVRLQAIDGGVDTGAYKIPGFSDIPQDFRVSLLRDAEWPNLGTIASSKGVGEPREQCSHLDATRPVNLLLFLFI